MKLLNTSFFWFFGFFSLSMKIYSLYLFWNISNLCTFLCTRDKVSDTNIFTNASNTTQPPFPSRYPSSPRTPLQSPRPRSFYCFEVLGSARNRSASVFSCDEIHKTETHNTLLQSIDFHRWDAMISSMFCVFLKTPLKIYVYKYM
jgi:hypothetical protein